VDERRGGEACQPKAGKDNERAGLVVDVTELAHRFPQPLGLVRTARDDVAWQVWDTGHPVVGWGERVAEGATEIRRGLISNKPDMHTSRPNTSVKRCLE